jgi:3-deoxy-D-manno-octulosonate 8-phosphate phosphatase (KDO 8-P phosphatase)
MTPALTERLLALRLLICDIDGVLTNGELYYGTDDLIARLPFHVQDGYGLQLVQASGIPVAVISGGNSPILAKRCADLGVEHVYFGQKNKIKAFEHLLKHLNMTAEHTAHIGDDLPDLPLFDRCTIGFSVADANPTVKEKADWISQYRGGQGAVREICDLILTTQNTLQQAFEHLQHDEK